MAHDNSRENVNLIEPVLGDPEQNINNMNVGRTIAEGERDAFRFWLSVLFMVGGVGAGIYGIVELLSGDYDTFLVSEIGAVASYKLGRAIYQRKI